jgi:hypothetical protein
MKLIIKDGVVIATHANNQNIKDLYGDLEIVRIPDHINLTRFEKLKTSYDDIIAPVNLPIMPFNLPITAVSLPTDPRSNWTLEESQENALLVIEDIAEEYRIEMLSSMAGKIAGYWTKEKIAARIISSDNPDQADIDNLQLEADNRRITVLELAELILKKAKDFANVSTYIDGEAQRIKIVIRDTESLEAVWELLKCFEQNIIIKINQLNHD